jgi:hypothetical protein
VNCSTWNIEFGVEVGSIHSATDFSADKVAIRVRMQFRCSTWNKFEYMKKPAIHRMFHVKHLASRMGV